MGVDPRFVDHVVVTSSTTRIDTDRLVCAAVQMRGAAEGARAVGLRLHGAGSAALEGSAMAPLETAWAHGALTGAETAAVELAGELDGLADALGFAALVYLAAEGGAASFEKAWRLLRPGSAAGWDAGWGTLHTRERIRDAFPSPLRPYVPEGLLDVLAAPFLPATVGGVRAGLWHLDSFREGRMSDGADMMRVQLDIEALSALVADHTMEIPVGAGSSQMGTRRRGGAPGMRRRLRRRRSRRGGCPASGGGGTARRAGSGCPWLSPRTLWTRARAAPSDTAGPPRCAPRTSRCRRRR
ncbi:hypothetical protein ACFQWG_09180 [Schaalia naturae]|uniref:Uncharacterized protein n=1 Tax=Schaalia naturae TaxID=635203 RepID=A0ABW2SMT8_9ACTO